MIAESETFALNSIFVGIDQTGAIDRKGRPYPLPACAIVESEIIFFCIPTLCKKEIFANIPICLPESLFVCIDCVLGLPNAIPISWNEALFRIAESRNYGKKPASEFFKALGQGSAPRRQIEKLCKANSVFNEKPFQKNIQTGTYRLWKDISLNRNDFWVPALEARNSKEQIPLYEGYPTLSWKRIFKVKKRSPELLAQLVKAHFPNFSWSQHHQQKIDKDPDRKSVV